MSLVLYAHPFSSYCQKVLIALYENATPFSCRVVNAGDSEADLAFATHWPIKRMPLLVDDGRAIMEASIIIEHLGLYHAGPIRLLPEDAQASLDVRFMDRFFDNYVMTPMQRIVADSIRQPDHRAPSIVSEAHALLDTAYNWLDRHMDKREWASGADFTLADCAAAPSLFYSDWVHPIAATLKNLSTYRARLLARPSFARAVEEARPYRKLFPPGAPDKD